MPLRINPHLTAQKLRPRIERLFALSAGKILSLERALKPSQGAPVFTVKGQYTSRGWTEWTQGFQFGSALLQYDATGDKRFLEIGRRKTIEHMATHVSHIGVHDHGFNNVSTYGNLWRLMRDGKLPFNEREKDLYETGVEGLRGSAGGALDHLGGWQRVYLFIQRSPLAVCGCVALIAFAGRGASAWPGVDG